MNDTERRVSCRYTRRDGNLCTGEAVDPDGEVLLCVKHLGRAMEMIRGRQMLLGAGRKASR